MKKYKLEEIGGNLIIESDSIRWGNTDRFGRVKNWEDGGPHAGNILLLDFEWSEYWGTFSAFQSDRISEINYNQSGKFFNFKTDDKKEYKLTIQKS